MAPQNFPAEWELQDIFCMLGKAQGRKGEVKGKWEAASGQPMATLGPGAE